MLSVAAAIHDSSTGGIVSPEELRSAAGRWLESREGRPPFYVVAEKILATGEPLPDDWAVHGTSGYDFLNVINGLFVDSQSAARFSELYRGWIDERISFSMRLRAEEQVLSAMFASELEMLTRLLDRLAAGPPLAGLLVQSSAGWAARGHRLLPRLPDLHLR